MRLITAFCIISIWINTNYGQQDSVDYYFDEGLQLKALGKTSQAIESLEKAVTFIASDSLSAKINHQLANLNYGIKEYANAISYWQKAITFRSKFLAANHIDIIKTYSNIGTAENILGHTKRSREALIKALELLNSKETNDVFRKANIYAALGGLEKNELNIVVSQDYLIQAYQLYSQCDLDIGWRQVNTCTDLFDSFKLIKKPNKALIWAQRALEEVKRKDPSLKRDIYLANAYSNRGVAFKLDHQYQNAKKDYLQALDLNLSMKDRVEFTGVVINNLIALYTIMDDDINAEKVITQAKKIFSDGNQPQLMANTLIEEAKFRHEQGDYKVAIYAYDKAQNALSTLQSSGNISELIRSSVNESTIVDLITGKLKSILKLSDQTNEIDLLTETELQIDELVRTINSLSVGMSDLASKLEFAGFVNEFFDIAVSIKYKLYRKYNDDRYAFEAWQLMDKAKSRSILDGLRWNEASQHSSQLQSLYQERKSLQNSIPKLSSIGQENQDSLMQLKATIGTLDLQIDSLMRMDNLWINDTNKKALQNTLQETVLMQYHMAQDSTYLICQEQDKLLFQNLGRTSEIHKTLEEFISNVKDPMSSDVRLVETASIAYQVLMPQSYINNLPKSLLIIPDGLIGKVPFEALIVDQNSAASRFTDHDYLIRHSAISYASSHAVLAYQMKEKAVIKKVVGFAISYKDFPLGDYNTLPHSKQELHSLSSFSNPLLFEESKATKGIFITEAQDASLLHLSLHGISDDQQASLSHLQLFPDGEKDDGKIYLQDIYHTDIDPELVILSACSSGDGVLSTADGTISFAHAFSYSRAKTIVLNLWDSASLSSHDLLNDFYEGITNQLSSTEALRQSKLNYLKNAKAPELAHPFYWSTLVIYGDPLPLKLSKSFPLSLVVLLAALGAYFIFRMIRAASST